MLTRTRLALFTLTLLSALAAAGGTPARQAQGSQRWEQAVQAFEKADRTTPPPQGAIVFVGSSSIRLWNTVREDMAPLTVIHRGFGGSFMQDAVHYADRLVINYKPRAVVLYEGDNDVGGGSVTPTQLLEGFRAFVSKVHAALPQTRIYFLAIKPSVLRQDNWTQMAEANRLVRAECDRNPLLTYIDVATPMLASDGKPPRDLFVDDMLHMTPKGYAIWKDVVRPILLEKEGGFEP